MVLEVGLTQQLDHVGDGGGGSCGDRGRVTRSNKRLITDASGGVVSASGLAHLPRAIPVTLDLFHSKLSSSPIELDKPFSLPLGWKEVLDLKAEDICYRKGCLGETTMSRNGKSPRLDLKLNLSPPRVNPHVGSPNRSASLSPTTPTSSCVSTELNPDETLRYSSSPEATSMVLVGCPRCLMYVMLSEEDPKCPKCKSTVLLDFLHEDNNYNIKANTKKTRKN